MMKKILIGLMIGGSLLVAADVTCIKMGDGYMQCHDDNGNSWIVYIGE